MTKANSVVVSVRIPTELRDALTEELEFIKAETFGEVYKESQALRYLAITELKRRRAERAAKEE